MKYIKIIGFVFASLTSTLCADIGAQYTPANPFIGALPGGNRVDAQTFTSEIGGKLSKVEIDVKSFGFPGANIQVMLLSTVLGAPTGGVGGVLGSIGVSASQIPAFGTKNYLAVDFSAFGLKLDKGVRYAIAVGGSGLNVWLGTDGGYSGGSMYTSANSGLTYAKFPTQSGDRDLGFKVEVVAKAVPEGGSIVVTLLSMVAIFGAIRFRRSMLGASTSN